MSNRNKAIGTAAETRVVKYLQSFGIRAVRKALHGAEDQGDIQVVIPAKKGRKEKEITFEVKGGKQTMDPNRTILSSWIQQARIEGINCGQESYLVVARFHKNPKEYDVWQEVDLGCWKHWYLDDWCKQYGYEPSRLKVLE